MADLQALVASLPVDQIAKQAGVSEADARAAIQQAVPALVSGMRRNADDPVGLASLEGALANHRGHFDARMSEGVDAADGEKIVRHVFGGQCEEVAHALAAQSAAGKSDSGALGEVVRKVLPILAPIVLAWIANHYFGGKGEAASTASSTQRTSDAAHGSQAEGANPFARSEQENAAPASAPKRDDRAGDAKRSDSDANAQQGGLGDLLGGLLGGSGGGLGDLLGGILGGKR